jgi:hypothetical protein
MKCRWCGRDIFYGDYYYDGPFCSEKCLDEWNWEKGGGKEKAARKAREQDRLAQEQRQEEEQQREQQEAKAAYLQEYIERQNREYAEKEHFRPFIEQRVGHPLRIDEIWWNEPLETWAAKEEILVEVDAVMKRLEQESGVRISALFGIRIESENDIFWGSDNGWYIKIHEDMAIRYYEKEEGPTWASCLIRANILGTTQDLAPYIAMAEYEGQSIQDLNLYRLMQDENGPRYVLLPDHSLIISEKELFDILKRQLKMALMSESEIEFVVFSPSENKFIREVTIWDNTSPLKKAHWVTNRVEVSLNELKILIPVKKIQAQPAPAAPKAAKTAPARPAKATSATAPKFCGECGTRFEPGEKFCGNCGAKI